MRLSTVTSYHRSNLCCSDLDIVLEQEPRGACLLKHDCATNNCDTEIRVKRTYRYSKATGKDQKVKTKLLQKQ